MGTTTIKKTLGKKSAKKISLTSGKSEQIKNEDDFPAQDLTGSLCHSCQVTKKSRRRMFSEKAWKVLTFWNEVTEDIANKTICEQCYNDLREVLIDRADEIEIAFGDAQAPNKRKLNQLAS